MGRGNRSDSPYDGFGALHSGGPLIPLPPCGRPLMPLFAPGTAKAPRTKADCFL